MKIFKVGPWGTFTHKLDTEFDLQFSMYLMRKGGINIVPEAHLYYTGVPLDPPELVLDRCGIPQLVCSPCSFFCCLELDLCSLSSATGG